MAYIYYPTSASLMTRTVSGSTYSEINIGVLPDRIMVFTQEGFTSSFGTCSFAFTASHALNAISTSYYIITQSIEYVTSASWASSSISSSYALSASYAPGSSGTSLGTGSTYPITSSWSENSKTASYYNVDYSRVIAFSIIL